VPPYGGSIAQNVFYADSDLCDPNVDRRKGYPIRAKDSKGLMESWPSPYILMVDRGGCTFVQKVSLREVGNHQGGLDLFRRSISQHLCLLIFYEQIGAQCSTFWCCGCYHC
jgi:hypothetical protein